MTKTEAKIIRAVLVCGYFHAVTQKQFDKAQEVLKEVMPANSYAVIDKSELYGAPFVWAFQRTDLHQNPVGGII